jgi:hypothetical protein
MTEKRCLPADRRERSGLLVMETLVRVPSVCSAGDTLLPMPSFNSFPANSILALPISPQSSQPLQRESASCSGTRRLHTCGA